MKTQKRTQIFITILILIISIGLWSFTSKNVYDDSASGKVIYCKLYVHVKYDITKYEYTYTMSANYGNHLNYPNKVVENNKVATFGSYMDALNYLGAQGWELVLTNRHVVDGYWDYEDSYILKKKIN